MAGQPLSRREHEVLTRAAAGKTVEETASELYLAIDTIKGYLLVTVPFGGFFLWASHAHPEWFG